MTLLEVGRIVKAHGIRGDVIVELTTTRTERLAPGTVLASDAGSFTVERASPHQGKWIVAFAEVPDRTAAERLRGTKLRAEPVAGDDGELWIHELIGAAVVDVDGQPVGEVTAVQANPASDLLVLADGHLVPLTFVVRRDPDGTVVIDPPAGLFDLD